MKTVIAFAFLIVGISAGPHPILGKLRRAQFQDERIVTGPIESAIEDISQQIKDAGLDPLDIQSLSLAYALPVEVLLNLDAIIEDLLFTGLSDIQIRNLNFGIITTRLTFDIELPRFALSIKNSELRVELFETEYKSRVSGAFAINSIRVSGSVRVNVGIITGISIRDVTINLRIGSIESSLNVLIANNDISNYLNTLLGERIPATLNQYASEIDLLLEILIEEIAAGIL